MKRGNTTTTEQSFAYFKEKCIERYGDIYDYYDYTWINNPVRIVNKVTKEESIRRAKSHMLGLKDIKFKHTGLNDFNKFKEYAYAQYGDKYEYLEYLWPERKVRFVKRDTGREYIQIIYEHFKGITVQERLDTAFDNIVERHKKAFPGKFLYSDYTGYRNKMKLTEIDTGKEYWQYPVHVSKLHLPQKSKIIWDFETFKSHCSKIFNNRFEYVDYSGNTGSCIVTMIDKTTGLSYKQTATHHIKGSLPKELSRRSTSKLELDVREIVLKMFPEEEVIFGKRYSFLNSKSIDIYFPNLKLGIECNGTAYHHSSDIDSPRNFLSKTSKDYDYHLNKSQKCLDNGIKLVHVFDYEIYNSVDISEKIRNAIDSDIIGYTNKYVFVDLKTLELSENGLVVYYPEAIVKGPL